MTRKVAWSLIALIALVACWPGLWAGQGKASDRIPLHPVGPDEIRVGGRVDLLAPPSREHPLGTDDRGRDVFSRLVHGTRATVTSAGLVAVLSSGIGLLLALAVIGAPRLRSGALLLADTVAATPLLVFSVVGLGLVGQRSLLGLALLFGVPRAFVLFRIGIDGLTRALAEPFVEAARSVGSPPGRILFTHALPYTKAPLIAATLQTAAGFAGAELALGMVGLGPGSGVASWGELFRQALENNQHWWLVLPVGSVAVLFSWALFTIAQRPETPLRSSQGTVL